MSRHLLRPLSVAVALGVLATSSASAQHPEMPMGADTAHAAHPAPAAAPSPLDVPMTRMGSGTSWVPDATPMYARHFAAGPWTLMLHGVAYGVYDRQLSDRGAEQVNSINWAMLMASRRVGAGRFQLHAMLSAEPWTVGARGYPLLLQSGETFRGEPIHDRQHPHDLFMELAAIYEHALGPRLGVQLYAAPVGEPALGPVAYPHRPSAMNDPFAPLGHHWQDATHITYGVATLGVFSYRWKLEGSVFNGREPDADRTDFDFGRLDSWSGRATFDPDPHWSLSASYGYLRHPEAIAPDENQHRAGASVLNHLPVGTLGTWSSALVIGANRHPGHAWSPAVLVESDLEPDGRSAVFGRAELVRKSAAELALSGLDPEREFDIISIALGYARGVATLGPLDVAIGGRGSLNAVPATLRPSYGTRTPVGLSVYLRVRPTAMHAPMPEMPAMPEMRSHRER